MMKKKYLILIVIILVYLFIVGILNINNESKKQNKKPISYPTTEKEIEPGNYIIFSDNVLQLKDDNWLNLGIYEKNVLGSNIFVNTLFDTYLDDVYKGEFYISKDNFKWYYLDKNRNSVSLSGNLFAISSSLNYKIVNYKLVKANKNDYDLINQFMKKQDINNFKIDNIIQKTIYDFDNDGINETMYYLTNMFNVNESGTKFSYVLYKDENIINILSNVQTEEKALSDGYGYEIYKLLNDNDKNILFINKFKFSNKNLCTIVYELENNKINKLNDC